MYVALRASRTHLTPALTMAKACSFASVHLSTHSLGKAKLFIDQSINQSISARKELTLTFRGVWLGGLYLYGTSLNQIYNWEGDPSRDNDGSGPAGTED